MAAEEFVLRWNNHQQNFAAVVEDLWRQDTFTDVILCSEGRVFPAHRVILSACSPYFLEILSKVPEHQHPVVFLQGVPLTDLHSLLTFMYSGEVVVSNGDMASFFRTAENLQIKGEPPHSISNPVQTFLTSLVSAGLASPSCPPLALAPEPLQLTPQRRPPSQASSSCPTDGPSTLDLRFRAVRRSRSSSPQSDSQRHQQLQQQQQHQQHQQQHQQQQHHQQQFQQQQNRASVLEPVPLMFQSRGNHQLTPLALTLSAQNDQTRPPSVGSVIATTSPAAAAAARPLSLVVGASVHQERARTPEGLPPQAPLASNNGSSSSSTSAGSGSSMLLSSLMGARYPKFIHFKRRANNAHLADCKYPRLGRRKKNLLEIWQRFVLFYLISHIRRNINNQDLFDLTVQRIQIELAIFHLNQ